MLFRLKYREYRKQIDVAQRVYIKKYSQGLDLRYLEQMVIIWCIQNHQPVHLLYPGVRLLNLHQAKLAVFRGSTLKLPFQHQKLSRLLQSHLTKMALYDRLQSQVQFQSQLLWLQLQ